MFIWSLPGQGCCLSGIPDSELLGVCGYFKGCSYVFEGILEDVVDMGAALNSHITEDWRSRGHCNTFSFFSTTILAQFLINELAWG